MKQLVKVGQTWLSAAGNLFRVADIREDKIDVIRLGFVQNRQEYRVPPSEFTFHSTQFNGHVMLRPVSGNPAKYDQYLADRPSRF